MSPSFDYYELKEVGDYFIGFGHSGITDNPRVNSLAGKGAFGIV